MKKLIFLVLFLFVITGCQSRLLGGKNEITAEKVNNKFNTSEIKDKYRLENGNLKRVVKDNPKDKIEVEIGNVRGLLGAGEDEFTPDVKISRWDDEVSLTLHPKMLDSVETKDKELTFVDEKVVFTTPKIDYQIYNIATSTEYPEGAFEYQIDLNEKPDTNIVSFDIETKGLDFFYQPALTAEEIAEGANRPDNVIGSYAVYASENKINYVGGKEYKVGKVGHIYRPKVVDSKGTEVWGDLNIDADKGILSVTIPQDFLDKAIYPVRHAAGLTFGYTSVGVSNLSYNNSTIALASLKGNYSASSGDTITNYHYYGKHGKSDANNYWRALAYVYEGGVPTDAAGSLTAKFTSTTDLNWQNSSDVTDILSNGVIYVIGFQITATFAYTFQINYDSGSVPGRLGSDGVLTDPFVVSGTDSGRWYSIYATYTASGGSTPATSNGQDIFWFN